MNQAGIDLLKRFEGCSLKAYFDVTGYACGFGTHAPDITTDTVWTQEEADSRLLARIAETEKALDRMLMVPCTENQYAALVDFAYNCGLEALRTSHLLKYFNDGDSQQAASEFLKWDHSNGQVLSALTARRKVERDLFLLPDNPTLA